MKQLTLLFLASLFLFSCEDGNESLKDNAPQITQVSTSNTTVGFSNTITLSAIADDIDDDFLKYVWDADDEGTFSNNSEGKSVTWTAPSVSTIQQAKNYPIALTVSDRTSNTHDTVVIEVIPAYNNFENNDLLNFDVNSSYSQYSISDNQLYLSPLPESSHAYLLTPVFDKRLRLPFTIESSMGLYKNFQDLTNNYCHISILTTYPGNSPKRLVEVITTINPNNTTYNWQIFAIVTEDSGENRTSHFLVRGLETGMKAIGEFNDYSLTINADKSITLMINESIAYEGDALKTFVEDGQYASYWRMGQGVIGITGNGNQLVIDKVAVK